LGSSLVERIAVNTGTVPVLPDPAQPAWRLGWVHRRPIGPGRGGAAVGVGARESRAQGEGRQRLRGDKETAMRKDAPVNTAAPPAEPTGAHQRVSEMQAKLHRWAVADPGRRFDDLFNFVHDPTLLVAFERVAGNTGANTPGVDGLTAGWVERGVGVPGFLEGLRGALKAGTFRPLPVRERKIPSPAGQGRSDGLASL
jgi:RNA-directed DNA polymerase